MNFTSVFFNVSKLPVVILVTLSSGNVIQHLPAQQAHLAACFPPTSWAVWLLRPLSGGTPAPAVWAAMCCPAGGTTLVDLCLPEESTGPSCLVGSSDLIFVPN